MSTLLPNKSLLRKISILACIVFAAVLLFAGAMTANATNSDNAESENSANSANSPNTAITENATNPTNEEGEIEIDVVKTAEWTNDERTNANVYLDITANEKISENPNFLFIGTMCSAHTLNKQKLVAAINGAAQVGSVDWYVYGNDFEGTFNMGHLDKEEEISLRDLDNLKVANHQTLGSFYDTIGRNIIDYGYKYDNIIMEFDRSRIADYYGQWVQKGGKGYVYNHESEYQDAVAKMMVDYYNRQKVLWIVDKDKDVEDLYTPSRYYYARNAWQSLSSEQYHALVGLMAPKYYENSDAYYEYDNIPEDAAVAPDRQTHYNTDPDVIAEFIRDTLVKPKFLVGFDDTLVSNEEAKLKPSSVKVEKETYPGSGEWEEYKGAVVARNEQNIKFLSDYCTGKTHFKITINFDDAGMYKVTTDGSTHKDPNYGNVKVDIFTQNSGDRTVWQSTVKPLEGPEEQTYKVTTEVVNGTIDPSMTAAAGEDVKVKYQPYSGFWLSKIYIDGQEMKPIQPEYENQYVFHDIVANHSIKVEYTQDPENVYVKFVDSEDLSTVYDMQSVKPGECAKSPLPPTKEGKVFAGGYTDKECTQLGDSKTPIMFNTMVFAGGKTAQYAVHFVDSMEYQEYEDLLQMVNHGELAKDPGKAKEPTKQGYTFTCWYKDEKCEQKFDFDNTHIFNTTYVYAGWQKNEYTVKFVDSMDTTTVYETQKVKFNELSSRPEKDPTKEKYYFTGWFKDQACSKEFDFSTPITGDTIVYAGWVNKPIYNVNFVDSMDIEKEVSPTQSVIEGQKATEPTVSPVKYGYIFTGWYTAADCKTKFDFNTAIMKNTTVYAGGEKVKFDVIFVDSMDLTTIYEEQSVNYLEQCTKPAKNPEKSGYNFTKWYADEDCHDEFNFDTPIEGRTMVYAGWELKDVHVKFVDSRDTSKEVAKAQTIKWNTTCTRPTPDPTKPDFNFSGWFTTKECTTEFDFSVPLTSDVIVYAGWESKPVYKVHFVDSMETSIEFETQMIREGHTASEPRVSPTREGYTFTKGYADAACKTEYDFDTQIYKETTVYAGGEKNNYTVIYLDSEDYSTVYKTEKVKYLGKTTKPDPDPSKEEKTFEGGFADAACKTPFDFNTQIKADTVIYAGGKAIPKYNVMFLDSIDLSEVADLQTVLAGHKASRPADPERKDFVFTGGYSNLECSTVFDFNTPIYEDTFVFAGGTEAPKTTVTVVFVDSEDITQRYETQTLNVGDKATRPKSDPTKEHKDFTGWYEDQKCTTKFNFDTQITINTVVYAGGKDKPIHTVRFIDRYDFTELFKSQSVEHGQKAINPGTPTKEGYTFNGWYADLECTELFDFDTLIIEDTYVFANGNQDPPSTVSVMFVDSENVSKQLADTQTMDVGSKATRPGDPTKEGKVFKGWFKDKECTKIFDFDTPITQNIILYAGWTPKYTVAFLDSIDYELYSSQSVVEGGTATRPADPPAKAELVFSGWYKDQFCREAFDFATPIYQDTYVYAGGVAAPKAKVNVLYVDSEDTSHVYKKDEIDVGATTTPPAEPEKEWETFIGWYSDKDCLVPFDDTKPITQNTIVYAGWYPKAAVVYVDLKDYEESNDQESILKKIDAVDVLDFSVPPENPDRERFIFTGWYYDYECTEHFIPEETRIIDDMIVYAGGVDACYVKFVDSMDVSTVYDTQKIPVNSTSTRPTDPTKEGYTFTKWYADEDCTEEFDFAKAIDTDTTVYAGWSKNPEPQPEPQPEPKPGPGDDNINATSAGATNTGSTGDNTWMLVVGAIAALASAVGALAYRRKMVR